ncbi:MAG: hypothetical protein MUQ30_13265 [Anaerolineae bacterium]|nr:hypothetical protein [Anaerolineae bacterium]
MNPERISPSLPVTAELLEAHLGLAPTVTHTHLENLSAWRGAYRRTSP